MAVFRLAALLHDGETPISRAVTLIVDGNVVSVATGLDGPEADAIEAAHYARGEVRVTPRVAHARRFVDLPDGKQVECADDARLDTLPQHERTEGPLSFLEKHTSLVLCATIGTVALAFALREYGFPYLADVVARRTPAAVEQEMGQQSLASLDRLLLDPTLVEEGVRQEIHNEFVQLREKAPGARDFTVVFRHWSGGSNAFALPGGIIVVTDELVEACTKDQVVAVLAHEVGHQVKRHALRQLLIEAGTSALALALVGDASSASVIVSSAPSLLLGLQYSREAETEADEYALALLRGSGRSPLIFAEALECLRACVGEESEDPSFLSSHPGLSERIAMARAAAKAR